MRLLLRKAQRAIVSLRDRVTKLLVKMVNPTETISMSIAAAILVLAQSVSPVVAEPSASRSRPVVATAQASARILRPARISFDEDRGGTADKQAGSQEVQRGRDENGTVWIEFS